MCGRFAFHASRARLIEHFGLEAAPQLPARYNITPHSEIAAVRDGRCELLRWGLLPHWSKAPETRYRMINAKAETVAGKPAFRDAFRHRRCLIPASGFYEWQPVAAGKQPWYLSLADGELLAFAGLWERWEGRGEHAGKVIESCVILTTAANRLCAAIHDRMPVIIDRDHYGRWLTDPGADLLRPFPAERMQAWPVSRRVNNPAHDDPALLEPQR